MVENEDKGIANFLFEAGMLQKTPRSGFQFLGSGKESVAEHSLMVIFAAYALAKMSEGIQEDRLLKMCMLHDLPEARTGDMNYVNKKYVQVDETRAISDMTAGVAFGEEISSLLCEYSKKATIEARLAHDADQIALLLKLKECQDIGNNYAAEWIDFARQRLQTPEGKRLAEAILGVDSADWWFSEKGQWWVNGKDRE
ncbi:MAG: HD domain-containing protein [Deltaproteobacteria bacterium]|nr:HD domain-containing protein [Deltaproteobacteria bacterium]